jgi:hypothetical protein
VMGERGIKLISWPRIVLSCVSGRV